MNAKQDRFWTQVTQKKQASYIWSLFVSTVFFLVGLIGFQQYGFAWDDPENLLTGYHYYRFYRSGDATWLDFSAQDSQYQQSDDPPALYNHQFNAPARYPPVANVAANLSHAVLTTKLQLLSSPDGYHIAILLFAALTIFVLACFSWQAFGPVASIFAVFSLMLYPLFFEHAHYNIKDIPFAALILLALWAFWRGYQDNGWQWFLLSAIATGLAMGVRVIAAEVYFIIGLAYLPQMWLRLQKKQSIFSFWGWLFLHGCVALIVFLLVWPWLWADPIARLQEHLEFGRNAGRGLRVLYDGQIWQSGETLPWHYTGILFVFTTPIPVLVGGIVGGWVALRKSLRVEMTAGLLLVVLFLVALVRTSLPNLPQYDGTRHMLDGIVAFAGLAGLGAQVMWQWFKQRWQRPLPASLAPFILILLFLPTAITLIRTHPFQGIYYNFLAGGIENAYDRYPQEYWGSSFRLSAEWLVEKLPADAVILPRVGGHLLNLYLPSEITTIPDEALPFLAPDQSVYVVYMTRRDKFDWVAEYVDAQLTPRYTISRSGVPIIKIVSTDAQTLLQGQ